MDYPPDFIAVTILDKNGDIRNINDFLLQLDLLDCCSKNGVCIPITLDRTEELEICKKEKTKIKHQDYALDLGFAFTAWKVQDLTYDCIIICIDG